MGIEWKGMEKLEAAFEQKVKLEGAKKFLKLNGAELQKNAIEDAPYKTGFLKGSILLSIENQGMIARVKALAHYAPYVEYGTRKMNARPFMRPAFNRQKQQLESDLRRLTK